MHTGCNRENMVKLVSALRSCKYPQASGRLKVVDLEGNVGYCCLGVAKEVAIANGVALIHDEQENAFLPVAVKEWLGLEKVNPWLRYDDRWVTAVEANDKLGLSLRKIGELFKNTYLKGEVLSDAE